METVTKQKTWHDIEIKGRWRLIYKVGNSQGPSAFGGYHLPVYPNPFTGQKTFLKNADGRPLNGYLIDRIMKIYHPENDVNENYLINWLICHPEVKIEGIKDVDPKILAKKKASKITLVCLDVNELDKFEEEDYQDKLIGLLSLDLGKNMISLIKLRYIMAYIGIAYREPRFEEKGEKSALRSKLKSYVRSSYENAQAVNDAIDNIDMAQNVYEFKELVRTKILVLSNGVYKFQNATVGTNFDTVSSFFENHPEVKTEALSKLYK